VATRNRSEQRLAPSALAFGSAKEAATIPAPVLIASATAKAVCLALLRQRCHAITAGQPPHHHAGADARQVARSLARTLDLLVIPRGGRRPDEVRPLEQRAAALEAKLLAADGAEPVAPRRVCKGSVWDYAHIGDI
jgi:hypothetical protein